MPRPPVKPQDRLRSAHACDTCKSSKKRCDGNLPCFLCSRKGLTDSCVYSAPRLRRRGGLPPSRSVGVDDALRPTQLDLFSPRDGSSQSATDILDRNRLDGNVPGEGPGLSGNADGLWNPQPPLPSTAQKPVMLSSSSGEKVFVGSPAAISFLRFLQKTLRYYVGPSGFTDGQHSRRLFEVATPDVDIATFDDDLADEERTATVQCFLEVSSGVLDLFSREEVSRILELAREHRTSRTREHESPPRRARDADLASLYLMIAIGAQCQGREGGGHAAGRYASAARKMAFSGMLEDPTVNLVRTFLLMAFYMLGACRRNSAFMYIGVASKSADILGLHASANVAHLSAAERDTRLRTAKSLRVFDIICSSILGRQSSSLPLRCADTPPGPDGHSALSLGAAYDLSLILDDIVKTFSDQGKLDTGSAEGLFRSLREWSRALPAQLRERPRSGFTPARGDAEHRIAMAANVHIASMYYFSVILVTRQFLVQHIMPQLRRHQSTRAVPPEGAAATATDSKMAELSQACIEAATYMVQTCRDAMGAGILGGNMCILKAWVFAAGLVLGFPLLVDTGASVETLDAFNGSREILGELGRLSPQAAQYHHILAAFSDAISTYREQVKRERRASQALFVEPILSFDGGETGEGDDGGADRTGARSTQLPTPEFTACDEPLTGTQDGGGRTDVEDTMLVSGFLAPQQMLVPEQWPLLADDELMLRLFWDGYATSIVDPVVDPALEDQGVLSAGGSSW